MLSSPCPSENVLCAGHMEITRSIKALGRKMNYFVSIRHGISSEITESKKTAKARCRHSLFPQPRQTSEILQGGFQSA